MRRSIRSKIIQIFNQQKKNTQISKDKVVTETANHNLQLPFAKTIIERFLADQENKQNCKTIKTENGEFLILLPGFFHQTKNSEDLISKIKRILLRKRTQSHK